MMLVRVGGYVFISNEGESLLGKIRLEIFLAALMMMRLFPVFWPCLRCVYNTRIIGGLMIDETSTF